MRFTPARSLLSLGVAVLLAGCGARTDLEPAAGQKLPPAPYGAEVQPESGELLELPTQAAPERNVELRRRSEEREDDPFDLPPDDGKD